MLCTANESSNIAFAGRPRPIVVTRLGAATTGGIGTGGESDRRERENFYKIRTVRTFESFRNPAAFNRDVLGNRTIGELATNVLVGDLDRKQECAATGRSGSSRRPAAVPRTDEGDAAESEQRERTWFRNLLRRTGPRPVDRIGDEATVVVGVVGADRLLERG